MHHAIKGFDNYGYPNVPALIFKHNLWLMSEFPIKVTQVDKLKESTCSHIPLLKALLLVLAFLIFINSTLFASPETKLKKVLVLASYKATAPVAPLWNRGIQIAISS
jgi:hypothetical protein